MKATTTLLAISGAAGIALGQGATNSVPTLHYQPVGPAQLLLSWPHPAPGFALESAGQLSDTVLWELWPQVPFVDSDQRWVVVTNTGGARYFRLHSSQMGGLPPDAASVAPPLTNTVVTTVISATEFLYAGTNAIQTGVTNGTIEARRAGALRGRVLNCDESALPGVQITILDHAELGGTVSRLDGRFDLAVNGGGTVTVLFRKANFLPAQRQATARWEEFIDLPDVVLLPHDTGSTGLEFSSNAPPMQVAQGGVVSDQDGTRRATLLIPSGTEASVVLAGGALLPVTNLHFRATEYTVGSNGPRAMPAALPSQVAYTYCVELTADEALAIGTKVAGKDVVFSQRVPFYVENFLDFPVGSPVPVGYYDNDRAVWVPEDNGRIIQVLGVTAGKADLDVNGDHLADSGTALSDLQITDAEREQLATLYPPGQSLWRLLLPHLSTFGCNWPQGWPPDASSPGISATQRSAGNSAKGPVAPASEASAKSAGVSIRDQVLGKSLPVAGTPFWLEYTSDRVSGRSAGYTLDIPVSGDTVPTNLARIEVEVRLAGRLITQTLPARTNQTYRFVWDGRNAYGQTVQGRQQVTVRVGYVYPAQYQSPVAQSRSFGFPGDGTGLRAAREEVIRWQEWRDTLGGWEGRGSGLGGWTLSVHHAYDPTTRVLYLGDGTQRLADTLSIVQTVAGGDDAAYPLGDGQPATSAYLYWPSDVAVGPDGSLYIADFQINPNFSPGRVRRVGPDGIIQTFAGGNWLASGGVGDGLPATQARLDGPRSVAVGPDGSVYVSEYNYNGCRVRRVGTDGIIHTVAGTGAFGFNGESGSATAMMLNYPEGIAVGADGSLYIADSGNGRVRCVTPDGTLATVAGGGPLGADYSVGDGGPARQAYLGLPVDLALAPDGTLYIADQGTYQDKIRRVDAAGRISTIAGGGSSYVQEGQSPVGTAFSGNALAFGPDGNLYVADLFTGVGRVLPEGVFQVVAGSFAWYLPPYAGFVGDGGPARQARFWGPHGLGFGPDGALYVADTQNRRVRVIRPSFPGSGGGDLAVASADGSEAYRFDAYGRHLSTVNALTGATLLTFQYGDHGWLTAVEDSDHNRTVIERASDGTPTAIVAPFGQRTRLEMNAEGYLCRLVDPTSAVWELAYANSGLLSAITDPRTNRFEFAYDEQGLLTNDAQVACLAALARSRSNNTVKVSVATAEGRCSSYQIQYLPSGGQLWVNTLADGTEDYLFVAADGMRYLTNADGSTSAVQDGADPRFSMQAAFAQSNRLATPAGLLSIITAQRQADTTNAADWFSLRALTNTITLNGKSLVERYEAATRSFTGVTPEGRHAATQVDAQGRLTQVDVPATASAQVTYDARGRLAQLAQGPRHTTFGYDPNTGYLRTATDTLGRTASYQCDALGRVTSLTLPDGANWSFAYDGAGNLLTLTEPNGTNQHRFTYTALDLLKTYRSPLGAQQTFVYDKDEILIRRQFPSGQGLDWVYNTRGQLTLVQTPDGNDALGYYTNGLMAQSVSRDGQRLDYAYDGGLLTNVAWSGVVTGAVSYVYDNDFRVQQMCYAGLALSNTFDTDSLLTGVGSFRLAYDGANGFLTNVSDGPFQEASEYNTNAELGAVTVSHGAMLYRAEYSYDNLGQLTRKVETLGGTTNTFDYAYDPVGQLIRVQRDGILVEAYAYDAVGNRTGMTNTLTGETLVAADYQYDADHKLLRAGSRVFTYDANGALATETRGGQTTTYHYSTDGTLAGVDLPDGRQVTYLHDAEGRRVARAVDGVRTHSWLYGSDLMPLAEYDGSGALRTAYIYAGFDTPVAFVRNGVTNHIVTDHLGSPRLVVDVSGAVLKRLDYDAWGNVILDSNPALDLAFGYAGGMDDVDHALLRFGARDYQPSVGRWTAPHSVLEEGELGGLYAYVGNQPVTSVDLDGLKAKVKKHGKTVTKHHGKPGHKGHGKPVKNTHGKTVNKKITANVGKLNFSFGLGAAVGIGSGTVSVEVGLDWKSIEKSAVEVARDAASDASSKGTMGYAGPASDADMNAMRDASTNWPTLKHWSWFR